MYDQEISNSPLTRLASKVQTQGPEDQDQRTKDQRTKGPEDQGTRGRDHKDEGTSGPRDQDKGRNSFLIWFSETKKGCVDRKQFLIDRN